jgi:TPR repeat protein
MLESFRNSVITRNWHHRIGDQTMKPFTLGLGIFAAAAVFAAALVLFGRTPRDEIPVVDRQVRAAHAEHLAVKEVTHERPVSARNSFSNRSASTDYRKLLDDSGNYSQYVNSILAAAKNGDPDAQYYLSKALRYCDGGYRNYLQRSGRRLTLDEGLQFAVKTHRPFDLVQTVYDRCHELMEQGPSEIGTAQDWLDKATRSGQPAAQGMTAVLLLNQEALRSIGAPNPEPSMGVDADPRELLRAAVQSRDPEVLWNVGLAQRAINQSSEEKVTNQLAWWIVACQRGFDCGANADWFRLACHYDSNCAPGETGLDYLQRNASQISPVAQERAVEINAKLDAGQWNELGIGS